jgi:hypothetical protein
MLQERLYDERDPKKIAALRAAIDVEQKRVALVRTESVFDKMNGVQLRDELSAQVLELSGAGSRMSQYLWKISQVPRSSAESNSTWRFTKLRFGMAQHSK